MNFAVAVKREPIAHEWQTIREVEGSETRTWIANAVLNIRVGCSKTEEASDKALDIDWFVALTTPNDCAFKTELEILSGAKTDFFQMNPWINWISMPLERTDHELISERTCEA